MPLFEYNPDGFPLHSGGVSKHRINCNELMNDDLRALAISFADMPNTPKFKWIIPVMRGGLRFASILAPMVYSEDSERVLIVDDVWTTGRSINDAMLIFVPNDPTVRAVVISARSKTPDWVTVAIDPWVKENINHEK